jgi:hypothetical protein
LSALDFSVSAVIEHGRDTLNQNAETMPKRTSILSLKKTGNRLEMGKITMDHAL